jgi:hypothetical protein
VKKVTDISKERSASFFRVKGMEKLFLQSSGNFYHFSTELYPELSLNMDHSENLKFH